MFYSDGKTVTKPKKASSSQNRNLWITNISKTTRATELKQALSEYGKVIGAKVVINARFPGTCCYGYVTMETVADADNCIEKLNNTELNGQIIKIEKVCCTTLVDKIDTSHRISHNFKFMFSQIVYLILMNFFFIRRWTSQQQQCGVFFFNLILSTLKLSKWDKRFDRK